VHRGKIGVLPEPPKPRDREFAADTYHELVAKAQELHHRLTGSNSARRLCNSVDIEQGAGAVDAPTSD
jgi:hypothetical protein